MSRSKKGGKPIGWEYWGKRKGGFWVDRKTSHKLERMQFKEEDRKILSEALFELGEGNKSLMQCVYMRNLFPTATSIEYYSHYLCGYDVLVVDGKHFGELNSVNELLAFSYHCGISYKDYADLENKYYEYLEENERYDFLP